jgi:hypothetical protein
MNTANGIYALLAGAGLLFFLVAVVIYLFLWKVTQSFMFGLLAWGLGIGATIGLKMILTIFCRKSAYRAFMRTRPRMANVSAIALETWYIGLGGGVLIGRLTQFLFAAGEYHMDEVGISTSLSKSKIHAPYANSKWVAPAKLSGLEESMNHSWPTMYNC